MKFGMYSAMIALFALSTEAQAATFTTFTDEAKWQDAVGTSALEDFETQSPDDQIKSLPALNITFDELEGGGFPQIYVHDSDPTGYGTQHLGNFPNGINTTNQFDDLVIRAGAGFELLGLGFWNGDGQTDPITATVYDAKDQVLGMISAVTGTFAGFTTDMQVSRVVFDGNTGDGWNHIDGLQTATASAAPIPVPAGGALLLSGLLGAAALKRRKH